MNIAKPKKLKFKQQFMMVVIILVAAAFLPVALLLVIGMLPTVACVLVDTTRGKTRSLTVGLLNFVTCFPFAMTIALDQPTMEGTYNILSEPLNLVIIFAGAVAGYLLDWSVAGFSNVVMTIKARARISAIEKRQEELVRRFGREVTGEIPLDADGFPIDEHKTPKI